MVLYLDTSALLKLYVEEEERELMLAAVEESERAATSAVAYVEARAGLARRLQEGDFTEKTVSYLRIGLADLRPPGCLEPPIKSRGALLRNARRVLDLYPRRGAVPWAGAAPL